MRRLMHVGRIGTLLSGAALLVTLPAAAQTTAKQSQAKSPNIVVNGVRMPAAEAPKSAMCEALSRDPMTRQTVALFPELVLQPTRPVRAPDYSKPPLVPAGSPLPVLGKRRFNAPEGYASDSAVLDPNYGDPADTALSSNSGINAYDQARMNCQMHYAPGLSDRQTFSGAMSRGAAFESGVPSAVDAVDAAAARFAIGRARIAARDTSLPMAFALFDQGRYAESFDWFTKAYKKLEDHNGGGEASLFIGKLYLEGLGERSNTAEAIKWLQKSALAAFNPRGMTPMFDPKRPDWTTSTGEAALLLGNIYLTGFKGVPKDPAKAYRWYKRAYEVGHVSAAKTLGDMRLAGVGRPRDPTEALTWYRKAAKLGLSSAQMAVANMLYKGDEGVKQDRHMALAWYKAAAMSDEPDAIYALGHALEFGIDGVVDHQRAIGFYKTAALKGSAEAAAALGSYFHQGKVVPRDDAVARQWFAVAAKGSSTDGLYNLGAMLANGQGGARDLARAAEFLRTASARGHSGAPIALAAVERKLGRQ